MNKKISITLKCKFIKTLDSWLNMPLHSEAARARNRIVKLLASAYDEYEDRRMELVEKYGIKDNDGNFKLDESGANYLLTDEEKFREDWLALRETSVTFDILQNRADWLVVKKVLEKITVQMDTPTTELYEDILSVFEGI